MNAVTQLRQTETRLVAAIEQAAAAVDAIGTGQLEHALADLEAAVSRARGRLDAALGFLQSVAGGLASDFDAAALAIETDAASTASAAPASTQDSPTATEPASAPSEPPAAPATTQEPGDGINLADPTLAILETVSPETTPTAEASAIGTDGSATGVNRVAEVLGAVPSANGHASHGKGRRRKGK